MRSDYVVEVKIKDDVGEFTPKVDCFAGSPEHVVKILTQKYCHRKTILDWIYKPLEISNDELRRLLRR